jgi:serine/threonine protein kinase
LELYLRLKKDWNDFNAKKKIRFNIENKSEKIKEYLNYKIITRNYSENDYLVKNIDAWFEESVNPNGSEVLFYVQIELCDKTLDNAIKELTKDSILKSTESLTTIGYYIESQIFIQILEGVNHLHKQYPPLIHRDLKPANILLKKCDKRGFVSNSQTLDLWLSTSFQDNRILWIRKRLNIRRQKLEIARNMTQKQTFIAWELFSKNCSSLKLISEK